MTQSAENDALTEADRNALDYSLVDSGCHGFQGDHPELYATAERIVRERMAVAWDEGHERVCGIPARLCGIHGNPYRVLPPAKIEETQ